MSTLARRFTAARAIALLSTAALSAAALAAPPPAAPLYLPGKGSAWRLALANPPGPGPKVLVYGAYDNFLRAAAADTGELRWEAALDGFPFSIAAANLDARPGDELLAATAGGSVYAFSPQGKELWRYRTGFPVYNVAAGIDASGHPFVAAGGIGRKVHLLSAQGRLRASHDVEVLVHRLLTADLDSDGAHEILAIDQRTVLLCLRPSPSGLRLLWKKDLKVPSAYVNWENPRGAFFAFDAKAADLTGDGRPELLFGDTYFNKQAILAVAPSGDPLWLTPPLPQGMGNWRRVQSFDRWYEFYSTALVTVAEARASSPGPEIIAVTGGSLRIFSAAGKLLDSAESALAFTDAVASGGFLYLGSTPNGDQTIYRLPIDANLSAAFAALERQSLARQIGQSLEQLRSQTLAAPLAASPPGGRHFIQMLSGSTQSIQEELTRFRQRFPYPQLQPIASSKLIESTPPLNPGGKPWNPRRWQTDSINGTQSVDQILAAARRAEQHGIPTLWNIGHSCMPFITLDTARRVLEAAPNATIGFLSAEDESPTDFPSFAQHYLGPLADLARSRGKFVMTKNKGLWWMTTPARPEVSAALFTPTRRDAFISTTEDSNSRTPEINLMARLGLRQAGIVPRMRASIHQDLFSFNRFFQWEHPRSGHPYLRLLVAHASLGAADFEFRISDRQSNGEFSLLGRESTEIFLHLLGKGLIFTPRPDQIAHLSPIGIAVHPAPPKFLADAHNGHAPQNWVPDPELENGVLPYNGSLWGLTNTAPHALTHVLFRKKRQFGYFVPPTPYGAVAIVPASADLTKVTGVREWWHTDGISLWRDGQPELTGMAAAGALRASFTQAARGLPFATEGDDVFLQALRTGENQYRLILIDPGWLDPADRRVRLRLPSGLRLRDLLSGQTLPVRNHQAALTVPAGSFLLLEAAP